MTNTIQSASISPPQQAELLGRLQHHPLYRTALQGIPEHADWASVPFLTRERLTEAFEAGELAHPDAVRVHLTPHPGGGWLPEYATRADIEAHGQAAAAALARAGVRPGDHVQIAFGFHRFAGGWIMQDGFEALGAKTLPFGPGETEAQLEAIQKLGVRVLVSAPSFAQKLGEAGARVELLISSGEPLTSIAGRRGRVEAALGGVALDAYASSEAGMMALETPEKNGLRVLEDWVYLEVVDPETGETLSDGERGELVVTHLNKHAMPLLRFRTGDLTRLERRTDGVYLPGGVFGNVGGMLKVKGVKLFPREVAFWLAGHGLDHTQHTLRLWSQAGADRLGLTVRGEGVDDLAELKSDFQRRFAMRLDEFSVAVDHEGMGVTDERA
ncbi:phenylacetate--CoA ligase family protein [Deinococcus radiopugnans]|uniref:Phenylacetate--CoA ligase n=1 Tax=Deinococcus radiopugnans ATCC 19172 TaxID=585398 RepID=A0A5C4Y5T2_9DEIO|nr:AMP-binding protein [Deinococcus radiopugnans]MBB6016693.1 phenylacetate-CoA ligase [Deinococcus radiopugnans ATCC 19172]TNM70807.1 phenylacetate--CoA ligase [Deinococcus radiopugnans ATCC 19172]